ncbi:MAG: UDP-N-acetylmuramoyl-L-alanine--D-glutamate ligase [Nitrospirota bacterium]|nr:UDP-N-acetylmuramoyl-L-alanine--D-glutamate ligase [Nitrospirota bacterium]
MESAGSKITIVGLARSGAGAARLLADMGAVVTVTDNRTEKDLADIISTLPASVRLCLGGHPDEIFSEAELIVVSPGVPLAIKPLADAKAEGKRIIGELELAYQIIESLMAEEKAIPFLAITGSNGKSTTTTLLNHMMKAAGFRTMFGGNIGNALTEEIMKMNMEHTVPDAVVAEISSFQLEAIETFRPHIAAILNITPDHLDRYHSMEEYCDAKAAIFQNQLEPDILVLNADDPETMKLHSARFKEGDRGPHVYFFSRTQEVEGLFEKDGVVVVNLPHHEQGAVNLELIAAQEIRIKGVHNLENAMAASAMALLAGCSVEAVRESLREFPGLEHRLELVRELDNVKYINDSKGTNVGAVIKSIESFSEPVILIAGGRDKAGDFAALRHAAAGRVKKAVLIGEAAGKIEHALGDVIKTVMARDLKEAVEFARASAKEGDVVLLSPACASFDMFRDFEDRGTQFKTIVMELGAVHA